MFGKRLVILLLFVTSIVIVSGCLSQARLIVMQPAKIDTKGINRVAVGNFEIAYIRQSSLTERQGKWSETKVDLTEDMKHSISRQIRAQVINALSTTPYFKLSYTDEFAKLENDQEFQKLISAQGYKSQGVDAVISGKIWVDLEKNRGADLLKKEMRYVQGGSENSLDLSIEKLIWWPYQSMRGNLILEVKLTRLNPTEVIAVVVDDRTFGYRIGGDPDAINQDLQNSMAKVAAFLDDDSKKTEYDDKVLPSYNQMVADLAGSIATNFISQVAVTEKRVMYYLAMSGDEQSIGLIEAGAYNMAIERLQEITATDPSPDNFYNLGICFEAIGDYGLASVFYQDAYDKEPESLIFAMGLGRIETLQRETPRLKKQLAGKK